MSDWTPSPEEAADFLAGINRSTYTRFAPSPIHGIGVFAVRRIPKGTDPFAQGPDFDYVKVPPAALDALDPEVKRLLTDLCVFEDGVLWVPSFGLVGAGQGWYLNHSTMPNMGTPQDGEEHGDAFYALRDIEPDEELTIDYGTYNDDPAPAV